MNTTIESTNVVRWPAKRLYWAVLDAPAAIACPTARLLPAGLWPDFAEHVPAALEELHAVCAPTADGRLVVCAGLKSDIVALDPATTGLAPDSVPSELGIGEVDPALFNLLVGTFEPVAVRRARTRTRTLAAAILLLLSSLVILGALRRAAHDRSLAEQADVASRTLLAQIASPKATDAELRRELDRLRSAAGIDLTQKRPHDAAADLQALLKGWPGKLAGRPQSISVGPEGVILAVLVEGDAAGFINALRPPDNWRVEEPSLTKVGGDTRINIRLRRTAQETRR